MTIAKYTLKGKFSRAVLLALNYVKAGNTVLPPYTNAAAPTSGTSGTLAGIAEPGALLICTNNKTLYINTNTQASPTWTLFSLTSGAGAFTGTFNGTVGAVSAADGKFTTIEASGAVAVTGLITATGGVAYAGVGQTDTVAATVTAGTVQTQVGAFALTNKINVISVCANDGDGVALPALAAGQSCRVYNAGAKRANVYPNGTGNIDAAGASTSVPLSSGARANFTCVATGVLVSELLGAKSA